MRASISLAFSCTIIASLAAAAADRSNTSNPGADRSTVKAVRTFDEDRSRSLDADELGNLNKAYAAAPTGPLATLDKNNDGHIDAAEIASVSLGAPSAKGLKKFDQDGNFKLDDEEIEALRKQFDSAAAGPLKAWDRNGDSRLDDDEIAQINERLARQSARQRKSPPVAPAPAPAAAIEPQSDSGSGSASLSWQRPTMNEDGTPLTNLAGYVIRYGRSPGALRNRVQLNDPKLNEYVIDGLGPGLWYFSVSTVTSSGTESAQGPVVSKNIVSGRSSN